MKTMTKRLSCGIAASILLTLCTTASAFYDPTIGRWVSRDPIGEVAEANLYGFALNRPEGVVDVLGLAPYGSFEVSLRDVDYKDETLKGFQSKYILDGKVPCPCQKKEDIVLIQAVDDPLHSPQMDVSDAQRKKNQSTRGGIPPPPYVEGAYYNQDPLLIVDAPLMGGSEIIDGEWEFEDCALCRVKSKDGTSNDQMLGCVKFTFRRVKQGQTELDVNAGGKTLKGSTTYTVKAEDPGTVWNTASKAWKNAAGH